MTGGTISGDTKIRFGDLTVFGNISATGSVNYSNTFVSTTSSLCAMANSPYPVPGLYVSQAGTGDIATFYDVSSDREVFHVGGSEGYPGVGVNTSFPNKDFTVVGDISATGIIYNNNFDSNDWNSAYTTVQANSAVNWNYQGTDLKALSAGWVGGNSAYTTVQANSANWDTAYSLVSSSNIVYTSGNQTISGVKTFDPSPHVPLTPTINTQASSKGYVDTTIQSAVSSQVQSDISGLTGATALSNIVQITQAGYDAIVTPFTNTLYIIVG